MTPTQQMPEPPLTKRDRLRRRFLADIAAGLHLPGKSLPAYRTLMKHYEVPLPAVQQLMRDMQAAGIVKTLPHRGSRLVRGQPGSATPFGEKLVKAAITLYSRSGYIHLAQRTHIDQAFMIAYPEYRLRYRAMSSGRVSERAMLLDHLQDQKGYSIFFFPHTAMPMFHRENILEDLAPRFADSGVDGIIRPDISKCLRCGSRIIGFPWQMGGTNCLFYNREAFRRHAGGIDPQHMDWPTFMGIVRAMKADGRIRRVLVSGIDPGLSGLILCLLAQRGGFKQFRRHGSWSVRFDAEQLCEAFARVRELFFLAELTEQRDLRRVQYCADELMRGDAAFMQGTGVCDPFEIQKYPGFWDRVGVAPIPVLPGGKPVYLINFLMAGIRRNADKAVRQASWEYILFCSRPEYVAERCRLGIAHPERLPYRGGYLRGQTLQSPRTIPWAVGPALSQCTHEPVSPAFSKDDLSRLLMSCCLFPNSNWLQSIREYAAYLNAQDAEP